MAGQDKPPSCLWQGRGVAPRTSRLLACGKGGGFVPALGRDAPDVYGRPILLARLAAGGSCPFLGLAAGEASPAPPGRGQSPLPTLLKGALPPRPPKGGKSIPPTPLSGAKALYREERGKYGLQGVGTQVCAPSGGEELPILETRCGGGLPRSPREGAVPPSNPPKGGSAPWPPERGEVSPLPPSYGPGGPGGTSRPVTGLDEPPSCLPQGRVRGRTGQAALLPAARAEIPFLQLCGNTRMRAENPHCPSVSERPLARNKVLCQAFFERKRGGEMYVHYWE